MFLLSASAYVTLICYTSVSLAFLLFALFDPSFSLISTGSRIRGSGQDIIYN